MITQDGAEVTTGGGGGSFVPTSRTIAGLDLTIDRSASELQASLGLLTVPSLASSSGWTVVNGSGAASITIGAARVSLGTGVVPGGFANNPRISRPHGQSSFSVDAKARIKSWSGGNSPNVYAHFRIGRGTSGAEGFLVYVRGDGGGLSVGLNADTVSGGGAIGTASPSRADIAGGQFWTRIVVGPTGASAYYGVGAAGVEPASWLVIGSTTSTLSWRSDWISHVGVLLDAIGGGSPDIATVDWDSISARVLGLP